MSIPLDRLYHFLAAKANRDMIIYRWFPHGSKKAEDLKPLIDFMTHGRRFALTCPIMICNDQEPLNHALYETKEVLPVIKSMQMYQDWTNQSDDVLSQLSQSNLRSLCEPYNMYDQTLLLHSEQNSSEIKWYQDHDYVTIYYWSHALLALDWFRYAQHDPELVDLNIDRDFLIYNRAWNGTREYRLKFSEMLVQQDLWNHCVTSFSPWCDGLHYTQHHFGNPGLEIQNYHLEDYFVTNTADSNMSADYCGHDYRHCGIEVVLETLMDDLRWHLTEKVLRPIACGMPFLLVSTPGALEYLRYYGFQTFEPWIDESYDEIIDPVQRIKSVQLEMSRIANMPTEKKTKLFSELRGIAHLNQKRFFSQDFLDFILEEYCSNLKTGLAQLDQHANGGYINHIDSILEQCSNRPQSSRDWVNQLRRDIKSWSKP